MYYDIILNMLKDTGIPPMQFREKTCLRGHRSLE
nr:MAG TPA: METALLOTHIONEIN 1, AMT, METAL REGULATION, TRANSLATION-REGULATION [Caudoviricetes sp.]